MSVLFNFYINKSPLTSLVSVEKGECNKKVKVVDSVQRLNRFTSIPVVAVVDGKQAEIETDEEEEERLFRVGTYCNPKITHIRFKIGGIRWETPQNLKVHHYYTDEKYLPLMNECRKFGSNHLSTYGQYKFKPISEIIN